MPASAYQASGPAARSANWTLLGQRTVNHRVDRDETKAGARDGDFRRIKLAVRDRAVTFGDVKVHYRNGGVQDVQQGLVLEYAQVSVHEYAYRTGTNDRVSSIN